MFFGHLFFGLFLIFLATFVSPVAPVSHSLLLYCCGSFIQDPGVIQRGPCPFYPCKTNPLSCLRGMKVVNGIDKNGTFPPCTCLPVGPWTFFYAFLFGALSCVFLTFWSCFLVI
jgi:hypothetical protein